MRSGKGTVWHDLANAIVLQAVDDYRKALNGIGYNKKSPEEVIIEIEKFFRSDYFEMLTKVNGEYLIGKLRNEHKNKLKEECKNE